MMSSTSEAYERSGCKFMRQNMVVSLLMSAKVNCVSA
jgi:hypothetical protein